MAAVLTTVVALHELGHMAAFRLMGHRKVRMIFIPLLGGIAIGGRPYDSRFEVAFVALMGAGFSAFIVPVAIAQALFGGRGWRAAAGVLGTLAGCAALFNVANLVPVWKFDGGQVLRQICPNPSVLPLVVLPAAVGLPGARLPGGISRKIACLGGRDLCDPAPDHGGQRRQAPLRPETDRAISTASRVGAALVAVLRHPWLSDPKCGRFRAVGEAELDEGDSLNAPIAHRQAFAARIGAADQAVRRNRDTVQAEFWSLTRVL